MSLKTIYDLTASALTPLHVGSGQTLEREYDYAVFDNRTWVIDQEQVAEAFFFDEDGRYLKQLERVPPARLLKPEDFQETSPLFRYVMKGGPRSAQTGAAIQAQVKDVFDRPYLPGSSLKGALRTVIFRAAFAAADKRFSPADLRRSRSWAAQDLEQTLLGRDPNHDLLKALYAADSQAIPANENLRVLNAQVIGRRKSGAPIALECVRSDAVFHLSLTIDDYFFRADAARQLGFNRDKRDWLTRLPELANAQAAQRIRQELAFYQRRPKDRAAALYRQLAGLVNKLPPHTFLLQVGWGGGWDSKTLAWLIPPENKETVIQQYNLAKGSRQSGDAFPKSRRAITQGPLEEATAAAPLGWLLVEMKPRPV